MVLPTSVEASIASEPRPGPGRRLARAAYTSAGFGLLAAAMLVGGTRLHPEGWSGPVSEGGWTQRSRAAFTTSGFYAAERDARGHFSWTGSSANIHFPNLNRSRPHRVWLTVQSGRRPDAEPPQLRIAVDGVLVMPTTVPLRPTRIAVDIPPKRVDGAVLTLHVTPTYKPARDPRALGIRTAGVELAAVTGAVTPSMKVLLLTVLAVAAAVAGITFCGLRGWIGACASVSISVGFVWLLLQDAAFVGMYPERLAIIGMACAAVGAAVASTKLWRVTDDRGSEWRLGAGLVLAAAAMKVAMCWHPLAPIGDGMFQVHKAASVHAGQYLFTSITPKPFFEFPYPVALYVVAHPFWNLFTREVDLVALLRTVTIVADFVAGVCLYRAVYQQWGDRATALICAALWPAMRAPIQALTNANLTNLFGEAMLASALACAASLAAANTVALPLLLAVGLFLTLALLSHTGALCTAILTCVAVSAFLTVRGSARTRRAGLSLAALVIVAATVAWASYYSRFGTVYRTTWTTMVAAPPDDTAKMTAGPSVKLSRWWNGTGDDYGRPGVPTLAIMVCGLVVLRRRHAADGVTRIVLGWTLVWGALVLAGLLTPVVFRATLSAAPAFAVLGAVGIRALGSRSRTWTAIAAAFLVLVMWDGWSVALGTIHLR